MANKLVAAQDGLNFGRGILMGGADIIPGVSGGTVALIVGIYQRLVTAISHVDATLLGHLRHGRFTEAAVHLDLRFLAGLGIGIGTGIVGLASLMNYLLVNHPTPTSAVFFGLIFASSILVARMVRTWSPVTAFSGVAGVAFAYWLVGQLPTTPPEGYGYLFLCGVIAICAMILPGISGAFILLLLGNYERVTGAIRDLVHFQEVGSALPTLVVFGCGCLLGLIGFSKLLRWLLSRHEAVTTAVLCGFMLGSLRKIWPFKTDLTPEIAKLKFKRYANMLPSELTGEVALSVGLAVAAFVAVIALDYFGRRGEDRTRIIEEAGQPAP